MQLDNTTENRNCCSCNMINQNTPNYATVDYTVENVNTMSQNCSEMKCTRENMMMQIRSLKFAINELALYLDTHPNDRKALCLHNNYCKALKPLKDQYQKMFGPLDIFYPCNKWRWLEDPWPWERGNF